MVSAEKATHKPHRIRFSGFFPMHVNYLNSGDFLGQKRNHFQLTLTK